MKRDFNEIIDNLKDTIASYSYLVDFKKVYNHVNSVIIPLNILNSLLGSGDKFDDLFISIIHKYPETLNVIPILLATRNKNYKINIIDKKLITFDFKNIVNTDEEYLKFVKETGLQELFTGGHITNLVDYIVGVEVGLDSNTRKNRTGNSMEDIVDQYLTSKGIIHHRQIKKEEIKNIYKYDELDTLNFDNNKQADKKFDFVFEMNGIIFLVETNFYGSQGSKLNETARSYEQLADEINKLKHFRFVWITDGKGWKSAKNNLLESYNHQEILLTLKDLENENLIKMLEDYTKELSKNNKK